MATATTITSYSCDIRTRCTVEAASELDAKDISLFFDCLAMRYALLCDLAGSHSASAENWRRTTLGLKSLSVELYTSDWKTLREILTSRAFLNRYEDGKACALGFKHLAQSRVHYKWILGSALTLLEETGSFRDVNQWVVFDSKVNFSSLDLTTECCTEYLDFERTLTEKEWPHLDVAHQCAKEMFGDFYVTDYPYRPRHGNGATLEVKRRDADSWHKNREFSVDGEVINYLRYRVPDSDWRDCLFEPRRGLVRVSEIVCVPKSMTKNRTISKEPTTLQFLQQDLFQCFDSYFSEHLSDRIDLHDQTRSRVLALQGSADGSYATIDLSCASDSVSVRHIEEIFDGLPCVYPLLATRSTHVHVRDRSGSIDEVIRTKKFAPMGSAVCFPTECAVFAVLCETAVRLETGRRSRSFDYVVYGDDIVIKSRFGPRLIELLDEFGFRVNREKSFYENDGFENHFREACGIEAFNGADITPLRLSRRLVSPTLNDSGRQAGLGVGIVDLLNRSYLFGYKHLHRWINDQCRNTHWYRRLFRVGYTDYCAFVESILGNRPPWVRVAMPFVITDDLHDTQWQSWGSREFSDSAIQRPEFKVSTAKTRRRPGHADLNDLFAWFVDAAGNTGDDIIDIDATGIATLRPRDLKWSKQWVPKN